MDAAVGAALFTTDDLSLATVLVMHDYQYTMESRAKWSDRQARYIKRTHWNFKDHDRDLKKIVDDYRAGVLEVEPREFTQALAAVRNAMYDHIGRARRDGR